MVWPLQISNIEIVVGGKIDRLDIGVPKTGPGKHIK